MTQTTYNAAPVLKDTYPKPKRRRKKKPRRKNGATAQTPRTNGRGYAGATQNPL